jgi:L-fuconolactonase
MAKQIDAHHHLWKYSTEEFGWIGPGMDAIKRDFLPGDLMKEMQGAGISDSIAVQARQTTKETEWLLNTAEQTDFIAGVVGWVPLSEDSGRAELERFADHPKLKGVRHVVQDEADDFYILREDFNAGIKRLRDFGLAYDILIFEKHLPQTIQFVDRHPNQVFVLDHIAKPRIREGRHQFWRENFRELSKRTNVYCKLSGVVTEATWDSWTLEQISPYMEMALEAFGPARLMFGSDWPVLLLASSYRRWVDVVQSFVAKLSPAEQSRIMGGTASEAYHLRERNAR